MDESGEERDEDDYENDHLINSLKQETIAIRQRAREYRDL